MQITAVDKENNLFRVNRVFSDLLVDKILATDWGSLPWQRQEGQEAWKRKRIDHNFITWIDQWHNEMQQQWSSIEAAIGVAIQPYGGTAFWIDEPGFECPIHTDGEMPGSLHLTWFGSGTSFYWYKDTTSLRYQVPSQPNSGYIMINRSDSTGYRPLLWHGMLDTVPENSLRITSYTWITPQ